MSHFDAEKLALLVYVVNTLPYLFPLKIQNIPIL